LFNRLFLVESFVATREQWRSTLEEIGDTRLLVPEAGLIFEEGDILIYDSEKLETLNETQR
jgi:hypothetical protein